MNPDMNEETIYRLFAGTATVYEKASVKQWLKEPENQEYFYKLLVRWEMQNPQFTPEVDQSILRHFDRMRKGEVIEASQEKEVSPDLPWKKMVLAACLGGIISWLGWFLRDDLWFQTHQNNSDYPVAWQLSDGSRVVLHPHSTFKIPRFGFGRYFPRVAYLSGEADFSVVHTLTELPFVVKTDRSLEVVVLGTEFSVVSRKQEAKVLLSRGKVQLRYQQGPNLKEVMMKPGDLVLLDNQNRLTQVLLPEPEKLAVFKAHRFDFNETSLREISALFSEQFGVKVTVAHDSLASWTVTGSFTAETVEEMLETFAEASNLKYRKSANGIFIFAD